MNKISELELILRDQNPDIVFVTETLPKNCKYDVREVELRINGYVLHVNENPKRGVSIYVKEALDFDKITYFTEADEKLDML